MQTSSEDENESSIGSDSLSERKPVKLKLQTASRAGSGREDQALLKEVLATRRAVEEVKEAIRGKAEGMSVRRNADKGDRMFFSSVSLEIYSREWERMFANAITQMHCCAVLLLTVQEPRTLQLVHVQQESWK